MVGLGLWIAVSARTGHHRDVAAEGILKQMREAYASLDSYSDTCELAGWAHGRKYPMRVETFYKKPGKLLIRAKGAFPDYWFDFTL